jgi:aspartyl aminopeptidase
MTHLTEDLRAFLSASPTSWHAVQEMCLRLAVKDYLPLKTGKKWDLEKGKRFFLSKGGTFAAFHLPTKKPERLLIAAAHTDSPALKLKPQPLVQKSGMLQLSVEVYGSPFLPSWLCRDLAIAGRIVTQTGTKEPQEHLIFLDEVPLFIPSLAPHLDKEEGKSVESLKINRQEHLLPIVGLGKGESPESYLEKLLQKALFFDKLLSHELFLVPLEEPRYIGEGQWLASYRLDNLASCFAALAALAREEQIKEKTLPLVIFWDHEEVGSASSTGASSPFFNDLFERICAFYDMGVEEKILLKEHSSCLSVDMAHAFNPNYESKYDPIHRPLLGGGVVVKSSASQRYSSAARGVAMVTQLAHELELPLQLYAARSDMSSGTTVGPLFATGLGIETVDIGLAQLAMHATRECLSCDDFISLYQLLHHFFEKHP